MARGTNGSVWSMLITHGKYFLIAHRRFLKDVRRPHMIVMEKFYEALESVSDLLDHKTTHVVHDHGNPEVMWLRHKDKLHNIQVRVSNGIPMITIDKYDGISIPPEDGQAEYIRLAKLAASEIEYD